MKTYEKLRKSIEALRLIEAQQFNNNRELPEVEAEALWFGINKLQEAKEILKDVEQIFRRLDSYMDTTLKDAKEIFCAKRDVRNCFPTTTFPTTTSPTTTSPTTTSPTTTSPTTTIPIREEGTRKG